MGFTRRRVRIAASTYPCSRVGELPLAVGVPDESGKTCRAVLIVADLSNATRVGPQVFALTPAQYIVCWPAPPPFFMLWDVERVRALSGTHYRVVVKLPRAHRRVPRGGGADAVVRGLRGAAARRPCRTDCPRARHCARVRRRIRGAAARHAPAACLARRGAAAHSAHGA